MTNESTFLFRMGTRVKQSINCLAQPYFRFFDFLSSVTTGYCCLCVVHISYNDSLNADTSMRNNP